MFSWSNTCAAVDLSVDSISGEGSFRVASRLYCVAEWLAVDHEKVKGAVACVQDFARHPLFTQRSFLFETGISMLNTAVTAADAVQNSARFDPWGAIGVKASPVIADLKSSRENILSRRKAMKDTRERWFSAETVASSAVGETAPRTSVRISDVVARRGERQWLLVLQKKTVFCCKSICCSSFIWVCSSEEFWEVGGEKKWSWSP